MATAAPQRKVSPGSPQFVGRAAKFAAVGAPSDRTFQFLASDGSVDRMGDTIDPAGWDCAPYLKNPVVLYAHDNQSIPIGRTTKLWSDETGLHCQIQIDDATDLDKAVFAKLVSGTLRAVSVGFRPIEMEWSNREDDDLPSGVDFKRQELLEITICPVPANANALAEARTKSMATTKQEADPTVAIEHIKSLGEHVKTLGEHCKTLGEHIKTLEGSDAVDANKSLAAARRKSFEDALAPLLLTPEQKAAVLKAADGSHVMHPEVAKHAMAAHKSLSKAIAMHHEGMGAPVGHDGDTNSTEGGMGSGKPGDDEADAEDEKAMAALAVAQARLDALTTKLTGRVR